MKKRGREKYPDKASPVGRGGEGGGEPLERILKTKEELQKVLGLRSLSESPETEREICLAGVPGSHPTCQARAKGLPCSQAGGRRWEPPRAARPGRRSAEGPRGGSSSGFSGWRRSWVVPQFPVQFGCCCFSSAGKIPSREMTITSS